MDCSLGCVYKSIKFNCQIKPINSGDIKTIFLQDRITDERYIGKVKGKNAFIMLTKDNPCDYEKHYPYFPKITSASLCENGMYLIVCEGTYTKLSAFDVIEYEKIFKALNNLVFKDEKTGANLTADNIIFDHNQAYFIDVNSIREINYSREGFLGQIKRAKIDEFNVFTDLDKLFEGKDFIAEWRYVLGPYRIVEDPNYLVNRDDIAANIFLRYEEELKIRADIARSGYTFIKMLGSGSFGKVAEVKKGISGKTLALKLFEHKIMPDIKIGDGDLTDIAFTQSIQFPYIVRNEGIYFSDTHIGIFMDVAQMSLDSYMKEVTPPYETRIKFMYQLGEALNYLDKMGVVHCDLKLNNVLVKFDNILLTDFGLISLKDDLERRCEIRPYRAPESFIPGDDMSLSYDEEEVIADFFRNYNGQYQEWAKNKTMSEIWTYGLLCVEIIYNNPFRIGQNTIEDSYGDDFYGDSYGDEEYSDYVAFITPNFDIIAAQTKGRTPYESIVERLRTPDDIYIPLLEIVAEKMVNIEQPKRYRSYEEFLSLDIFDSIRIENLGNFESLPYDEIKGRKIGSYTNKSLNETTVWMFEFAKHFKLPLYVIFTAADFFLQKVKKYANRLYDVKLFALCCIWIYCQVYQFHVSSLDLLHKSDEKYLQKHMYDMILDIIKKEKALFLIDTIYNYLPTYETLKAAYRYITDVRTYAASGPSGISKHILKNMEPGNTPKTTYWS